MAAGLAGVEEELEALPGLVPPHEEDGGAIRGPRRRLGEPLDVGSDRLSLVRVCPYPVYRSPIGPDDYRFSLRLTDSGAAPEPELPACLTS